MPRETNPLRLLMQTPLPTITQQRRRLYRPSMREICAVYDLLNDHIFNNELSRPIITVKKTGKHLGQCTGRDDGCEIILNDRWYCAQIMVITLAHEMAHQYQWDVIGKRMIAQGKKRHLGHGSTFYIHRHNLLQYDIPLKRHFKPDHWLHYQDFYKC